MTYYNDCNNVPGSEGGRTDERTAVGRPYAPVGHVPPISRQGGPPDPQCTYSSSRSSPSPITIMPRVAPVRASRSMIWHPNPAMETEWASCFEGSIKKSGMANVTASLTSGDDSLSLLFSPLSLTPPLSQKSSSRESDRGCVRPRRRATVRNQEELCRGRPRWRRGAREG